jgi:hypothetical protein
MATTAKAISQSNTATGARLARPALVEGSEDTAESDMKRGKESREIGLRNEHRARPESYRPDCRSGGGAQSSIVNGKTGTQATPNMMSNATSS